MLRTQTLDHKHTNKERETKIYKVRKDTYVSGTEERDLLIIYIKYKRITIASLKNTLQKSFTLTIGSHLLFIGRRRNPKTVPSGVQNSF